MTITEAVEILNKYSFGATHQWKDDGRGVSCGGALPAAYSEFEAIAIAEKLERDNKDEVEL